MKIYHSLEEYRADAPAASRSGCAVTLGKFDGLHLGHRKLVEHVKRTARERGLLSAVFVIDISGCGILTKEERAAVLEDMGIDVLIECRFSRQFMQMTPQEFIRDILAQCLHAVYVAVGTDYRFGHERAGDVLLLEESGPLYGFETDIVEKARYLGEEISSTRVRDAICAGDMELVTHLLGRSYSISGEVRHGRHLGTGIGMPTVNLAPPEGKILPPDGVYAGRTLLEDGTVADGVTNIGFRPTVNGTHRTVETTLLDFDRDLYGQKIEVTLIRRLRGETRFDSLQSLRAQVDRDIAAARQILGASGKED